MAVSAFGSPVRNWRAEFGIRRPEKKKTSKKGVKCVTLSMTFMVAAFVVVCVRMIVKMVCARDEVAFIWHRHTRAQYCKPPPYARS
eukprot:2512817-Rhodomonas_salina.1